MFILVVKVIDGVSTRNLKFNVRLILEEKKH
jgi:hypothetical protein